MKKMKGENFRKVTLLDRLKSRYKKRKSKKELRKLTWLQQKEAALLKKPKSLVTSIQRVWLTMLGLFGLLGRILRTSLLVLLIGLLVLTVYDYHDMGKRAADIHPAVNSGAAENAAMADYTNIALFGVDSREDNLDGGKNRSDTMMILSINNRSGDIKLLSFMRDTYLKVTEDSYGKANSAYNYGGPEGAVSMINRNTDLNISEFITVGFTELADTIDALGGIDLPLTNEEVVHLNKYLHDMSVEIGTDPTPVEINPEGATTVTGIQAVAYARIRYTAGDDFKRAERAQAVLIETVKKGMQTVKRFKLLKARNAVKSFMCRSYHSLSVGDLWKLTRLGIKIVGNDTFDAGKLKDLAKFPRRKNRIPDAYIKGESCILAASLKDNIVWLHRYMFGEEDYQVSPEAQEISRYLREFYD